ncbi:hypothetical protein H9Q69_011852 [Fusarium xylarioides]|uniref:Small secreted protein n=1 Tax=Fusarium xylarioides TaxID=221167 RepID=A0A9P7HT47_9HYPO|nr:hypothetical protein H9Q70_004054 [Fusarium xylarioides]KAG5766051.1 hypothetical protein H9Q72_005895 [Fusarium xylarioides]KAG5782078.1 hypothetical protein H9Q73_004256 [Fusarium xylarioides]KAG5789085.1 hypothetical protein H9Q69_011852 [Fusarium xylarioides]
MVSLRDIGLLLLAAPAIAAPKAPAQVTVKTLPFSPSSSTSKAPSSSASTSPASDAAQKAACQLPLRFTNFALYSDTGCKNVIYDPFMLTWDPCKNYQWTNALANGVIFQSMRWTGGSNAQDFYACQQGFSCNANVARISQQSNVCSSGGGLHFDKLAVNP